MLLICISVHLRHNSYKVSYQPSYFFFLFTNPSVRFLLNSSVHVTPHIHYPPFNPTSIDPLIDPYPIHIVLQPLLDRPSTLPPPLPLQNPSPNHTTQAHRRRNLLLPKHRTLSQKRIIAPQNRILDTRYWSRTGAISVRAQTAGFEECFSVGPGTCVVVVED